MSFTSLNFKGVGNRLFYVKSTSGSETVPISSIDGAGVTIDNGTLSPSGQTITTPDQWQAWSPDDGPLSIAFPDDTVRFLWVVTTQAQASPPVVWVWASNRYNDLWASPPMSAPSFVAGFVGLWDAVVDSNGGTVFFDTNNGVAVHVFGGQKQLPTIHADTGGSIQVLSSGKLTINSMRPGGADAYPLRLYAESGGTVTIQNQGFVSFSLPSPTGYSDPGMTLVAKNNGAILVDGNGSKINASSNPLVLGVTIAVDGGRLALTNGATVGEGSLANLWTDLGIYSINGSLEVDGSGSDISVLYPSIGISTGKTLRLQNGATLLRWAADVTEDITLDDITVNNQSYSPLIGNWTYAAVGLEVTFTNSTYNDGSGGAITSYAWDFGDSVGTSTQASPTYSYASAGTYTVTMTANTSGSQTIATKTVVVT